MTNVFEIQIADPGAAGRLGPDSRKELRKSLREASRLDGGSVLISVETDAWAQASVPGPLTAAEVERDFHGLLLSLFGLARPAVVHLSGGVSGFGMALALAADLRVGADGSTYSVGDVASVPLGGLAWLLTQRAGAGCASRLAWTSATLSVDEAYAAGLLGGVGDAATARAEAERLAELPAQATSALKRSLNRRVQGFLEEQLGYDAWLATVAVAR